jgi:phosphoribosyl 1,2-cyclic phosphodiesterase
MPTQFAILGSGSGGNSAYLETDKTSILIDAGFTCSQLKARLESLGRSPENIDAILITHEHGDHIRGLQVLSSKYNIPIFANRLTVEAIEKQANRKLDFVRFQTGSSFEIGDIIVENFSIPHDAQDPVGFNLRTSHTVIGILTDLGHITSAITQKLRDTQVVLLEANYDKTMLELDRNRPWSVKQRIMSRHGHLSNNAAAEFARNLVAQRLQHIFLGHLSRDCNTPVLAHKCMTSALLQETCALPHVYSTSQDQSSDWLIL